MKETVEKTCKLIDKLFSLHMIEVDFDTGIVTTLIHKKAGIIIYDEYNTSYQNTAGYYYKIIKTNGKIKKLYDHQVIAFTKYRYTMVGYQVDHINNSHNYHKYNRLNNLQLLSVKMNGQKKNKLDTFYNNKVVTYYPSGKKITWKFDKKIFKIKKRQIRKKQPYKYKLVIRRNNNVESLKFKSWDEVLQSSYYKDYEVLGILRL